MVKGRFATSRHFTAGAVRNAPNLRFPLPEIARFEVRAAATINQHRIVYGTLNTRCQCALGT